MSLCGIEAKRGVISLPTAIPDDRPHFLRLLVVRQRESPRPKRLVMLTNWPGVLSSSKKNEKENDDLEMPYSFVP